MQADIAEMFSDGMPLPGNVVTVRIEVKDLGTGMRKLMNIFDSSRMDILSLESVVLERDEKYACTATFQHDAFEGAGALRKEIMGAGIDGIEITVYNF